MMKGPASLSCTASGWCSAVGLYWPRGQLTEPMAATRS
jgi:hypothetical protein